MRWPSTLLLASAIVAAPVAADGAAGTALVGGARWYGGTTVVRRLAVADGSDAGGPSWRLVAFGAVIAEGRGDALEDASWLRVEVPAVRRTIPARLELCAWDGGCSVTDVLVYAAPPAAPFGRARVGWVGAPPPGRAGATPIEIERVSLGTATAISRFRGRTIVLAPGAGDVTPLVPALLGFARGGGAVLALGADAAPWVSEGRPPSSPPAGLLLYDLPPGALVRWSASGGIAKRPLRPPAGAHLELVPGLVRLAFVGEGCVLVARLRLVEALADEPLAALLVARLRAVVACASWLHDFAARAPDASDRAFWRER